MGEASSYAQPPYDVASPHVSQSNGGMSAQGSSGSVESKEPQASGRPPSTPMARSTGTTTVAAAAVAAAAAAAAATAVVAAGEIVIIGGFNFGK